MKITTKKLTVAVVVLITAALTAACAPPPEPPSGWHQRFLTRDGADVTTVVEKAHGRIETGAPRTNTGTNSRTLFGRVDAPFTKDHYSCATVAHSGSPTQEGVALRMRSDGERHRGITVMKNIWMGVNHTYNVHVWDTNIGGPLGAHQIAGFPMHESIGTGDSTTRPRRLCAKVEGRTLTFKVWFADQPEPAWNDPVASRTVTLPAGWAYEGQPGLYIGHLPANGWAVFTEHTTGPGAGPTK